MANVTINVTIQEVHDTIKEKIIERFPELKVVDYYREIRNDLPTPACFIEMTEMEPEEDRHLDTGQLAFRTRWDVFFIISFKTDNAKMAVRNYASEFAVFCEQNRWGLKIDPAKVMWAGDDEFRKEMDKFEIWRVEWSQVLFLGPAPDFGGITPQPYLGFAPNIGIGHEDDYIPIMEIPEHE